MKRTMDIVVIGSVSSKQYQKARLMALHEGLKPRIRRLDKQIFVDGMNAIWGSADLLTAELDDDTNVYGKNDFNCRDEDEWDFFLSRCDLINTYAVVHDGDETCAVFYRRLAKHLACYELTRGTLIQDHRD